MLKASLQSAIEKVQSATEAKYRTIDVINEHTRVMKRTIDEGEVSCDFDLQVFWLCIEYHFNGYFVLFCFLEGRLDASDNCTS